MSVVLGPCLPQGSLETLAFVHMVPSTQAAVGGDLDSPVLGVAGGLSEVCRWHREGGVDRAAAPL